MLCFNVLWILILTVWGLIGIHTDKFGFKHVWEIWYDFAFLSPLSSHTGTRQLTSLCARLYQAYYGLMVCPWYAYSQTMISEVSPLPQMYAHHYLGVVPDPRLRHRPLIPSRSKI